MPIRLQILALCATAFFANGQTRIVKIVGDQHILALRSDGTVVGWGQFHHGQLGPLAGIKGIGFNATHLVPIALPAKAIDIAAGDGNSFALLENGTVVGWGDVRNGLLGLKREEGPLLPSSTQGMEYRGIERPMPIAGLNDCVAISLGYAVLRDGTVRRWGTGARVMEGLRDVVAISTYVHSLALTKDGRVFAWGPAQYGALGRMESPETPGEVRGVSDIIAIAAGAGVSTALKRDGTVWVWGANWNNQFGFGERTDPPGLNRGYQLTPQKIPALLNVTAIAVGGSGRHSIALLKDGTIRSWGNTDWGQLGVGGSAGFRATPVMPKIASVKAIFAAGRNSYAVLANGALWAWGGGGPREWPLAVDTRVPAPLDLEARSQK